MRDHKEFPASLEPALTLAAAAAHTEVAYKGNTIGTRVWARETPFDGTLRMLRTVRQVRARGVYQTYIWQTPVRYEWIQVSKYVRTAVQQFNGEKLNY